MGKIDIVAADVATYMQQDRRNGDRIPQASLTPASARRFLLAVHAERDPDAPSKLNPSGTNQQLHDTLMLTTEDEAENKPLRHLHARNVIRHCGISEKKWKELWNSSR